MNINQVTVKLNSGHIMPLLGLGTWKSSIENVFHAVQISVKHGYRHIDCASDYENEEGVGASLASLIDSGVVKREELFITTKLWNTFHQPEDVRPAFEQSLSKLQCSYVDLYLMHFPTGENDINCPSKQVCDVDYVQTWKSMEKLVVDEKVRSIGLSNFNAYQLNRIIDNCDIVPAVNQIENHPYLCDENLVQFCKSKNIHVTAYSPLGSLDREWASKDDPCLLDDKVLNKIASKYHKTVPQIVLRFQLQRGISVIPKSVSTKHIKDNFDVFNFEITPDDMKRIFELNRNWRAMDISWIKGHKYFPFGDDYKEP